MERVSLRLLQAYSMVATRQERESPTNEVLYWSLVLRYCTEVLYWCLVLRHFTEVLY